MTTQEIREMLDSTITSNGKREISGQSLNSALQAILDVVQENEGGGDAPDTPGANTITIAPLTDAEAVKKAFDEHHLVDRLGRVTNCLIKVEASEPEYTEAMFIVEDFGENGYKLTFLSWAISSDLVGESRDEAAYTPKVALNGMPCMAYLIQPNGYIIPLGSSNVILADEELNESSDRPISNKAVFEALSLRYEVVTSLPELHYDSEGRVLDRTTKVYLVPSSDYDRDNQYEEYVLALDKDGKGGWEKLGAHTVNVNLEGYAKKSEIPTKTSNLTNDSGFIKKADIPSVDWNASTYKDGHIKNRTHHMLDHYCHYFKGSPITISKPNGIGYVVLTYDTDLSDKFIRIAINANESKTYEFLDSMGMPLSFRWDAGNSTINVESLMGAVETYGMRAYYSSSAKGFEDYFTKLDKGFMPKEVITDENASFMDDSSSIILPFGIKSGDFKTYSVVGDGNSVFGAREVDLGEINDSRKNITVVTKYSVGDYGRSFSEYGEFSIDELKEKNNYGEGYHWLLEGGGFVGVKVDENNHLWATMSISAANSWTIQCNAYSEKRKMSGSWIDCNGEDLLTKIASLESRIKTLEGK